MSDQTARDELAGIIDDRWHGYGYNPQGDADAILAAGWRKLVLDDATVERAARALWEAVSPEASWDRLSDKSWTRGKYRAMARAVLAAAVEEER